MVSVSHYLFCFDNPSCAWCSIYFLCLVSYIQQCQIINRFDTAVNAHPSTHLAVVSLQPTAVQLSPVSSLHHNLVWKNRHLSPTFHFHSQPGSETNSKTPLGEVYWTDGASPCLIKGCASIIDQLQSIGSSSLILVAPLRTLADVII